MIDDLEPFSEDPVFCMGDFPLSSCATDPLLLEVPFEVVDASPCFIFPEAGRFESECGDWPLEIISDKGVMWFVNAWIKAAASFGPSFNKIIDIISYISLKDRHLR